MFESLKLTIDRTLPYWNDVIVPQVSRFFVMKFYLKIRNFILQHICTKVLKRIFFFKIR